MIVKFLNTDRTELYIDGASARLDSSENYRSITDTPTRDKLLAWLSLGNTPEPSHTPVTNISDVTRVQAFHALASVPSPAGTGTLYDDVSLWVSGQQLPVRIDFYNREIYRIDNPVIQQFKTLQGWTDQRLQELFDLAATL